VHSVRGRTTGSPRSGGQPVRFLVDAQLPPVLAQRLREVGHDAQAVRDVGLRDADDNAIWKYALAVGAAIVTKDGDFPQRAQQAHTSPVIIWLCVGNASNHALEQWFLPQLPQIIEWIEQGVRVLEIR
jgi:predicted nuclease of predicted toxin-antitoxin system